MKPILFSTPMVQAIVAGNKTQTRRVIKLKNPFHKPGDILWVRETWRLIYFDHIDGDWSASVQFKDGAMGERLHYLKNGEDERIGWRPSIFMPRAAARLFLRVTDVRVERVQDIREGDAMAEGAPHCLGKSTCGGHDERCEAADPGRWYRMLWDSINGKREGGCYAWGKNPWVWVYTFERISKEEALAADCA